MHTFHQAFEACFPRRRSRRPQTIEVTPGFLR